jgi:hypothetical protein
LFWDFWSIAFWADMEDKRRRGEAEKKSRNEATKGPRDTT